MHGHLDNASRHSVGRPQGGRISRTALYLVAWFGFLIAAVALAARFLPVTNHVVLGFAALAPYLLFGAVLSTVVLLLTRQWWAASAASMLVVVSVGMQIPMFTGPGEVAADAVPLRVLTANLYEGRADSKALVEIARERVDVLAVQELTPELTENLVRDGLESDLPYKALDAQPYAAGVGIWSRYPLSRSNRSVGYPLGVISAAVRHPHAAAEAVVLTAHHAGPWPQPIDDWRRDVAAFADTLRQKTDDAGAGAVIVAGDFNASMDIQDFRRLLGSDFRDAAEQSGAGLTPTYPGESAWPPFIGIDRILTSRSSATDAQTVRIPGSDHLGLWAIVHLPG
jgi:endonuclease/exonuclease/phosphatase (EEP) superfamily protein YafD